MKNGGDPMKKKTAILVIIIVIIALAAVLWFYGYYSRKSDDDKAVEYLTQSAGGKNGSPAASVRLSETVRGYETLSYGAFKERTGKEAESYHADLFIGEIPDSSLCIVYEGEYDEELGGPVLSDDDRPIRLQGTLEALMDGIGGRMSVTDLTAALSEGDAAGAVCELLDGAGTAYYVGDRYAEIQFDSDRDGEYDARLLISLENAGDEDVGPESTAWFAFE